MIRDDQRPRVGFEIRFGFKHANGAAAARESRGGKEPGGRAADDYNLIFLPAGAGLRRKVLHDSRGFPFYKRKLSATAEEHKVLVRTVGQMAKRRSATDWKRNLVQV